jgi:hypothetical protein
MVYRCFTNISDHCAASVFRVEVHGEWKVAIDISRVRGGVEVRWVII